MSANFSSKSEIKINAPASKVWQALTSPDMINEFLLGTHVETDWKVGSDIRWTGNYNGKSYEDKGKVLQVLPEKLLQHTYHSSLSGIEDKPENYFNVTYELDEEDGVTTVTLTNSNLPDQQSQDHTEKNWRGVLEKLKEVVERETEKV
jgi:uncharacterized protein YndB with AHSA1/START domain